MVNLKIVIIAIISCGLLTLNPCFGGRTLKSFHDLKIEDDTLLLLDIDHTLLTQRIKISEASTSSEMYKRNETFLNKVQEKHGDKAYSLIKDACKPGESRTEDNLPQILENLSQRNIQLIPFSIRGQHKSALTETQLKNVGYDFDTWNKHLSPLPLGEFGGFIQINSVIYKKNSRSPEGKGLGIKALLEELKTKEKLPKAVVMVDDKEENIKDIDTQNPNPPTKLLTYHYIWKRFDSSASIKKFYQETLGKEFNLYETLFDEAFTAENL